MPNQPEDPEQDENERQRRRNKWVLFGILVATAIALYVAILVRFYKGG